MDSRSQRCCECYLLLSNGSRRRNSRPIRFMSTTTPRLTPRYAHIHGRTQLEYSPEGKYLISVGANRLVRKFIVESDDEPITIEQHEEPITAVAVCKQHFATCSTDGTVSLFGMEETVSTQITRSSLPVRDISFSPDGRWLAMCSE